MALSYNLAYQEIISVHPTRCQNFCWQNRLVFLEHLTMSHLLFTLLCTIQTALHSLNSSKYAYNLHILGKVRTLLEWADGLLSKMLCEWMDWVMADT